LPEHGNGHKARLVAYNGKLPRDLVSTVPAFVICVFVGEWGEKKMSAASLLARSGGIHECGVSHTRGLSLYRPRCSRTQTEPPNPDIPERKPRQRSKV